LATNSGVSFSMSKFSARSRAPASMLPYSFGQTDMPFSLFRQPLTRLQSRLRNTALPTSLEMKMHARADAPAENAQSWSEVIFDVRQVA
jgi:hypothetical protein